MPPVPAAALAPLATASAALLLACVALAGAAPAVAQGPQAGTVELHQYGRPVVAAGGVFELDRAPFAVRVTHAGAVSLFATAQAEAADHLPAARGAPLAVPLGEGAAARPLVLPLNDAGLEWYPGLTLHFLHRWGMAMGGPQLREYALLSHRLGREPPIVVSPRQSLAAGADGVRRFMVFALDGVPLRASSVEALVLFVFLDHPAADAGALWGLVQAVEPLRLRFRRAPDATTPAAEPSAPPAELDCGRGAAVAAVRDGDWRRVERLIAQGLDPSLRLGPTAAPLLVCAAGGSQAHGAVVNALLEAGAAADARTGHGATALHWALRAAPRGTPAPDRLGVVELLIAAGAQVDAMDEDHETPLLEAVSANQPELAARLLAAGANPLLADARGETAVARARRLGLSDLADLLALY